MVEASIRDISELSAATGATGAARDTRDCPKTLIGGAEVPAQKQGRRRLQQQLQPPGQYFVSGQAGPHAFNLIFSNLFDFALQRGLYYLVPQLGDIAAVLQRYMWLTDLADGLDAPLDNIDDDQLRGLIRRFTDDFCSESQATSSETVLFEYSQPTLTVELVPLDCPIRRSNNTGRNQIIFEECSPAQLLISLTPYTVTGPYYTGAQYTAASCTYEDQYGVDLQETFGGGSIQFNFTGSVEGVDIQPLINQINTDIRGFRGFANVVPPLNNLTDVTLSVGNFASGIFGGRR
ncbi:hypothetical protein MNEG_7276 [Monoraphidium neglectum]|uniref:Uncharacterized protein n=1 Tax=Monoraphidium neglectum TaxID=145388 RepID=A0A0D2JNH5_9CHLO|nr:hypothetical protein MNEG_7276 [Monoraphidium neglectum]KIZ00688.1 hypothetical protein MNEG_7276 [Monoraphidium neglectum]|eukprot:XP_013899707.1 hypothetical protein MNEG_7276 [Monoraphidium neglectum]